MYFHNNFIRDIKNRDFAEGILEHLSSIASTLGHVDLYTIKDAYDMPDRTFERDHLIGWTERRLELANIVQFSDGFAVYLAAPDMNGESSEPELPNPTPAPISITIITDDNRNVSVQTLRQVFELADEYPERPMFVTIN